MNANFRWWHTRCGWFCTMLVGLTLAGCSDPGQGTPNNSVSTTDAAEHSNSDKHDAEHSAPETYAAAIDKLADLTTSVCTAFKNEKPEDAHEALHSVGHLLESLPGLATKSKVLPEEAMNQLKAAVESMFDAFSELDGTLHGGEAVEFASVESKLTESLETLRSFQ